MVAGGSGSEEYSLQDQLNTEIQYFFRITPMFQIMKAISLNPSDSTQIALVYSCHTEKDILLREELDKFAANDPKRFQIWYTITKPSDNPNWKYTTWRVNQKMFRLRLFAPDPSTCVFVSRCIGEEVNQFFLFSCVGLLLLLNMDAIQI